MYNPDVVRDCFECFGEREWSRLEKSVRGLVEYQVTMYILRKHLPKNACILDAGGGPGRYAISLARIGPRVRLVDISKEQLRLAEEQIATARVGDKVAVMRPMDICDMGEIPDASFDAVICLGGALSYVR